MQSAGRIRVNPSLRTNVRRRGKKKAYGLKVCVVTLASAVPENARGFYNLIVLNNIRCVDGRAELRKACR